MHIGWVYVGLSWNAQKMYKYNRDKEQCKVAGIQGRYCAIIIIYFYYAANILRKHMWPPRSIGKICVHLVTKRSYNETYF